MAASARERMQELGTGLLFLLFGLLGITYAVVSWIKGNPFLSLPMSIVALLSGLLFVFIGGAAVWRAMRGK